MGIEKFFVEGELRNVLEGVKKRKKIFIERGVPRQSEDPLKKQGPQFVKIAKFNFILG